LNDCAAGEAPLVGGSSGGNRRAGQTEGAHLRSSYAPFIDGKQVARGVDSIEAIEEAGGWRITSV
jgi:hypothetical protein